MFGLDFQDSEEELPSAFLPQKQNHLQSWSWLRHDLQKSSSGAESAAGHRSSSSGSSKHCSPPPPESKQLSSTAMPNATIIMQPMDMGIFSQLKNAWQRVINKFQLDHWGSIVIKNNFPALFKTAWYEVATREAAMKAFKTAGLFPFEINNATQTQPGLYGFPFLSKNYFTECEPQKCEQSTREILTLPGKVKTKNGSWICICFIQRVFLSSPRFGSDWLTGSWGSFFLDKCPLPVLR